MADTDTEPACDPATAGPEILDELFRVIEQRRGADPAVSYTAKLLARGTPQAAKKMGEEAVEAALAAVTETPDRLVDESTDLLYHLLVLWAAAGVEPAQVWRRIAERRGISGIDEKKARKAST